MWGAPTKAYLGISKTSMTGTIPSAIGLLEKLGKKKPVGCLDHRCLSFVPSMWKGELNFDQGQWTGNVPTEMGNMVSLVVAYLSSNDLSGTVPSELGRVSSLGESYAL